MGIYGNTYLNKDYTTETFLSDLEKSYSMAESAIDNIFFLDKVVLKEEETGLSVGIKDAKEQYNEKEKSKLSNRLKEMLISFMRWVKNIWDKLVENIKKAIEKMRELTLRDKAMTLLFDKLEYDDIQKARDSGWKGVLRETTIYCLPASAKDSEIVRLARNRMKKYARNPEVYRENAPKNIYQYVDNIINASNLEKAESAFKELKDNVKELLGDKDNKSHSSSDTLQNRAMESMINRIVKDQDTGNPLFTYPIIKNPKDDRYAYPNEEQFNGCKLLALKGEKYVLDIRKGFYDSNIKGAEDQVNADVNKIMEHKLNTTKVTNDENNKIMGLYYKGMLVADRSLLTINQRILSEVVQLINYQIKESIKTWVKMFSTVKAYSTIRKKEATG